MANETIFERIIKGELPSDKIYESEAIIAIKDLYPKAEVHILIIPKKVIPDLQSMKAEDFRLMDEVITVAQTLAARFRIVEGYRLLTNNGRGAGQTILHLHFHLMGGKDLPLMA